MYPFPSLFAAGSKVGSRFDAYGHVHPSAMFPPAGVLLYCLWRFEQPRRIDEPSLQRHMLALLRTMYPTNVCLSFVKGTSQPPASPVSTHPKQGNPSKIRAQRVATWLAEPLPFGTFEPPKSKGGRVKQGALASSRHWLGERNGPEQHRAASAVPKARHSPQRHP